MEKEREKHIKKLAETAFRKQEIVTALECMNTPLDFLKRKQAFINLQLARKEAYDANLELEQALKI